MQVLRGCEEAARGNGVGGNGDNGSVRYHLSYWNDRERPEDIEARIRAKGADSGVILVGHSRPEWAATLLRHGVATVLADQEQVDVEVDTVLPDNFLGGMRVAEYLIQRGFRRVGWLGGPGAMVNWTQRLVGVRAALAQAGLSMRDEDCRNPCGDSILANQTETYEAAMMRWLDEGDLPEALILPATWLAAIVQRIMLEKGLRCPDDLSMISFDDDLFASMCSTEPTRMATFPVEIGRKAMQRIIQLLRYPDTKGRAHKIIVPMALIEGRSIGLPGRSGRALECDVSGEIR